MPFCGYIMMQSPITSSMAEALRPLALNSLLLILLDYLTYTCSLCYIRKHDHRNCFSNRCGRQNSSELSRHSLLSGHQVSFLDICCVNLFLSFKCLFVATLKCHPGLLGFLLHRTGRKDFFPDLHFLCSPSALPPAIT